MFSWLFCQNKLVISLSKDRITCLYIRYLYAFAFVCSCTSCHKSAMKPDPSFCCLWSTQSSLVLFSGGDSVVSSLWGRLRKTKPPPKVQPVRSLSTIHPFHYFTLISCVQLLFVCCSFIQHKPPEPPQDSKVGPTVRQGNHEDIKNNQIKARHSLLEIKWEFLYYFTVSDSAEVWMVVFISSFGNLSLRLETFGRAQWPQIFRGAVSLPVCFVSTVF